MLYRRSLRLAAACATGCAIAMAASTLDAQSQNGWPRVAAPAPANDVCSQLPGLTTTGLGTGNTNGDFGTMVGGESVTMTTTLGTATGGTFRIVGDPSGTNTLAGPASIPGTLTFVSSGALPGSSVGVGYFIDSAVGGTVDITVTSSCRAAAQAAAQIPATSTYTLLALVALLGLSAAVVLIRRRA